MKKRGKSKIVGMLLVAMAIFLTMPLFASAHCDTMDGPTAADGLKALETGNINHALIWVTETDEPEITEAFENALKVRNMSPEAQELADRYFLENLVRIHRAGEGAAYTGLKPSGTPIDEIVLAADESILVGNLSPLEGMVPTEKMPELTERFEKAMSLKNYDVNDVAAGRAYVEAYVQFFHFAEGDEAHADAHATDPHAAEATDPHAAEQASATKVVDAPTEAIPASFPLLPWVLAGVFAFSTVLLFIVHLKKGHRHQ